MADSTLRLNHLIDRQFVSLFRTHFPQIKPLRLPPLLSRYNQQLTINLHNKQSPKGSLLPSSIKTPSPGSNGSASAVGSKSPPTSRTLRTPFPSSKFSPSASVMAFCMRKGNLSRSDQLSNTSARSVKYSHLWGTTTPGTTAWGISNFGWDASWNPIRRRIILQQECGPSLLGGSSSFWGNICLSYFSFEWSYLCEIT